MEKLLACQITVVMGVRNVAASQKSVFAAIPEEKRRNLLHFETLDTGNLKSVREFAAKIKAKYAKVDLLINNGEYGALDNFCVIIRQLDVKVEGLINVKAPTWL